MPDAASATARPISRVAAVCSSAAAATCVVIPLSSSMVRTMSPIAETA
ncbi:hypothetical protein [Roseomonas sp. WA12]